MKTYISNFILLSGIFLIFSCKENQFLKNHNVILVTKSFSDGTEKVTDEAIEFEKKHNIKFKQANEIYLNFISRYEKIDSKTQSSFYPSLIIDDYYVYSFENLKTQEVATFGVGINANTGKQKSFTEKLWLQEKDILDK